MISPRSNQKENLDVNRDISHYQRSDKVSFIACQMKIRSPIPVSSLCNR